MATTKAAPGLLCALESFVAEAGGVTFRVARGDLIEDTHPLVKKHPTLFGPPPVKFRVEAATAAPGEKRGA